MSVRDSVIATLAEWLAPSEEQSTLRHAVAAFVLARPDACERSCVPGHITASVAVLDHTRSSVLLTLHPRLGRWVQLGGHCEPEDDDILAAARREGVEESGIADIVVLPELAAVHVHPLTCSLGVPTRHLDLQFVAVASEGASIAVSEESLDLRWWPVSGLPEGTDHALAHLVSRAVAVS